jgi:hypothetical protein
VAAADKIDVFRFKRPPRADSFMRWLGSDIPSRDNFMLKAVLSAGHMTDHQLKEESSC